MTVNDISDVIEKKFSKEVEVCYSHELTKFMTSIELLKKKKKVKVTLEFPLDILKDPTDVSNFQGVPILSIINLK